jgi:predicted transporter
MFWKIGPGVHGQLPNEWAKTGKLAHYLPATAISIPCNWCLTTIDRSL